MVKKKKRCYDYIIFSDNVSNVSISNQESNDIPTIVVNITKHVTFNNTVVTHIIEIEDRKGYWTEDRFRFQRRCDQVKEAISFIFDDNHRVKMRIIVNLSYALRNLFPPNILATNILAANTFTTNKFGNHIFRNAHQPPDMYDKRILALPW